MGFAKPVPRDLVPPRWHSKECHLVAQVLPMGFVNPVGVAQHIHRNVVRWISLAVEPSGEAEKELRRDKGSTTSSDMFRVYLDNWDDLRKVDQQLVQEIEGKPSAHQLAPPAST